ncbi:MAG TPA: protein kinase [Solirubrobacterales bacterium]|nr:protein kinase [Solirubrobacterales bacterium]
MEFGSGSTAERLVIASGRRLGDRYRLERAIGRGGMASVWLATDERLDRPVAIKVMSDTIADDPDYLTRFRREARVAAGLQHPHLVSIYDFASSPRPYLVMELIDGGDLARRLDSGDPVDPERLARELLSALRHIHAAGVLHRDIKPQNVLLDAHDHARLTDFGIAQPRDAATLTKAGQVIGTESYNAPEVLAGEGATEASDLYALGVVLSDAARGGARAAFWELTERMCDPDPTRRPPSAAAALAELDRTPPRPIGEPTEPFAVEDEPTVERPARPFEPSPTGARTRSGSGRRGPIVALLLGGAAVIAAVVLALGSGGGGGDEGRGRLALDATPKEDQGSPGDAKAQDASRGNATDQDESSSGASVDSGGASAESGGASVASGSPSVDSGSPSAASGGASEDTGGSTLAASSEDGWALNDQGYALVQEGSYEEAIPVLERAVDALRGAGDETTYNYALYNLGTAYLRAGRPEDAIPLLEERMKYDDGQLGEVQATLDEAYAAAG